MSITGKSWFIIAIALLAFGGSPLTAQETKSIHAPVPLPGVDPEMHTPEYWIALQEDADEIIMTPAEIAAFNEMVRTKNFEPRDYYGKPDPLWGLLTNITSPNLFINPILPLEQPDTLPGDTLRVLLRYNIERLYNPPALWGSRDFFDGRNVAYDKTMKDELADKMNVDAIPDKITRRFGIVVNHISARYYPTAVPGNSNTTSAVDRFQAGAICVGTPVTVLHESRDGDFLFAETPYSRAWLSAKDVAIADRETVRKIANDKNILMAAGNKVAIYGDPSFKNFARYFYFSSTLPLVKRDSRGYVVKMPYRKSDGSLGIGDGYVKPDADVHVGYFPYTKRNVITHIFKLLGQPYGWEDRDNKRDCCGTMLVLLRCFGITTGRLPGHILSASEHVYYINPNLSAEQKTAEVAKLEPVITMAGNDGHIVLLLGKARNGKLYFMHQCGWGYNNDDGDHCWVNRVTINATDFKLYNINAPNVYTTFRK